jgi:hypothetical protein
MSGKPSKESIDQAINFYNLVCSATDELFKRWNKDDYYMTFTQAAIYPVFFRNSYIWDSITVLFSNTRYLGTEFLIRPLFEGVTKFEWCMLDEKARSFRYKLSSMESTLEYAELKPRAFTKEEVSILNGAVAALRKEGVKALPDINQMCKDLIGEHGKNWYGLYKYFSKLVHSAFETGTVFERPPNNLEENKVSALSDWQSINCLSLAGFLQMRNIILMGMLFEPMRSSFIEDLEAAWSTLYYSLLAEEENKTK